METKNTEGRRKIERERERERARRRERERERDREKEAGGVAPMMKNRVHALLLTRLLRTNDVSMQTCHSSLVDMAEGCVCVCVEDAQIASDSTSNPLAV